MKRYAALALIAALAVPIGIAEANQVDVVNCPEGQRVTEVRVGNATLSLGKPLPPGHYIEDWTSGAGPDYTVRTYDRQATVYSDRPVDFKVVCR